MRQRQLRAVEMILLETGTYNDQFLRPFEAHMDGDAVSAFGRATQGAKQVTAASIAGVAGTLMSPSAVPVASASIDQGWGERRFSFIIKLEQNLGINGLTATWVITGYTNHFGLALTSQSLDPNMKFYINNSIQMRNNFENTPLGMVNRQTVVNASQVIKPDPHGSLLIGQSDNALRTCRPEDVVGTIASLELVSQDSSFDLRSTHVGASGKANRSHFLAPSFVAGVYNQVFNEVNNPQSGHMVDMNVAYERARENLRAPSTIDDPFLLLLQRQTGYSHGGFFTYRELLDSMPEAAGIVKVVMNRGANLKRIGQRGDSEDWGTALVETQLATVLCQCVPSLMMELGFVQASFTITNKTINNQFWFEWQQEPDSLMSRVDLSPHMAHFQQRLFNEIMPMVTQNSMMEVQVAMTINIIGDTFVNVQVWNNHPVEFVMPTFTDSLFAPVLCYGREHLIKMGNQFESLLSSAIDLNANPHFTNHFGGSFAPDLTAGVGTHDAGSYDL